MKKGDKKEQCNDRNNTYDERILRERKLFNSHGQMGEEQLDLCKTVIKDLLQNKFVKVWFTYDPREYNNYTKVIKNLIWINKISENLENHRYRSIEEFFKDICLVFQNAMNYNASTSRGYAVANRQLEKIEKKYTHYMSLNQSENEMDQSLGKLLSKQSEIKIENDYEQVQSLSKIDDDQSLLHSSGKLKSNKKKNLKKKKRRVKNIVERNVS